MSRCNSKKQSKRSQTVQRRNAKKAHKARKASRPKRRSNKQYAKQAMNNFFGDADIFSEYQFHGNIKWTARDLARIGLLFSWSEKKYVTDAFTETVKRSKRMAITTVHTTYQGFMGAMANYVHIFIPLLILRLQQKMQGIGGEFWEVSGFVPIAFDGSRNSASRTQSNEQELCSAKGKKKAAESPSTVTDPKPQAWITLMWHMGFRLPWDWRLGPSDSSERGHVRELIEEGTFPENTLFCGDAGFVGYDFWRSMVDRGHDFMVRVGSNVKLIGETVDYRQLEGGEVFCWPKNKQGKQPPLRLRLVHVTVGTAEVYLLTSVLSSTQLPASSMATLYKMRWGIEIEFRGLKQTLNGQKLCCRNADRLYTELHWSLLSMAVAELLAVTEQIADKDHRPNGYTPKDRSLAGTMRAIYDCLDDLREVPPLQADLFTRFAEAVTDDYQRKRSKKARYRPKQSEKKKKKIKPPEVRPMNNDELKILERMALKVAA
jgi:hypothetical protein